MGIQVSNHFISPSFIISVRVYDALTLIFFLSFSFYIFSQLCTYYLFNELSYVNTILVYEKKLVKRLSLGVKACAFHQQWQVSSLSLEISL